MLLGAGAGVDVVSVLEVSLSLLAAIEIDVAAIIGGDEDAGGVDTGEGSFTSITVTKLVGVSDRVGDCSILASSIITLFTCVLRRCDVNSSMH